MLKRQLHLPPEHLYPPDEWRIVERRYSENYFKRAETMFALSNGYIGIRGTFEEGEPALAPGTFINGFHETWRIAHAEDAYGLARTGQSIINVPDATMLRLYVDDEPLFVPTQRLREYSRVLDMRAGTLTRELVWSTAAGKRVLVRSSRLVSLEHRHLVAISLEVVLPENRAAAVAIVSPIVDRQAEELHAQAARPDDPRLGAAFSHRVLKPQLARAEGDGMMLGYRASNSGMTLAIGAEHIVETAMEPETEVGVDGERGSGEWVLTAHAQPGVPIRVVKYLAYQTSRSASPEELAGRCTRTLRRATRDGLEALQAKQREHLNNFWDRADVRVEGGRGALGRQQAIRWNLFQVAQACWRAENSGVPSKGLTGQAYDGHFFWDTEIYLLPLLTYTQPRIARNLLRYRYSMLPRARERARELNQRGAMFPWRTISGEEASAYYQAGTAQYHINADIALAIQRYVQVRGDLGFLLEAGAEILVETARLWEDLGFYAENGSFHIHGVTGPDEYTTVVNNNTFTNLMARSNLNYAAAVMRQLQAQRPDDYAALVHDVGLEPGEVAAWERAAAAMHIPYDQARGIHPQDANFLEREVWDIASTSPDRFPLLLHYHPLFIYRHQVIKQADVVLALFLLGNEFDAEQKRRNFEYYDRLTTGDSSLSACMESIVAAEVGDEERALQYFRFAMLMDIADVAGNASDGAHIASAAGVWQALVFGFGGVRNFDGELTITPRLPRSWASLSFSLRFQGRQLRVHLTHDEESYVLDEGEPLEVEVRGARHVLERERPLALRPPEPESSGASALAGGA